MSPKLFRREIIGRWRLAAGGVTALTLLSAAAVAGAAWTAPIAVSSSTQSASQPQVAVDATGNAVFAWRADAPDGVVQTRVRSSTGNLSSIQGVSAFGGARGVSAIPDVAVTDSGAAVYAWRQDTEHDGTEARVQARWRSAAGAFGAIRNLSRPRAGIEDVEVAAARADGDAVVVWQATEGDVPQIQARARPAGGPLGPLLELTPAGQTAINPRVAIDHDGDAIFTWQRLDGATYRVETRTLSSSGVLGPTEQVSSSRWTSVTPQVAMAPAGAAVYVWKSSDPDDGGSRIEMRGRLADGTLIRRQTVSDALAVESDPQVAVAADGSALFAWRLSNASRQWLNLRPRTALGALGTPQTLTAVPSPQTLSAPRVSLDAEGDAVIAWEHYDASGVYGCCVAIQAITRASTGALGGAQKLSGRGNTVAAPEVASGPTGDAVVVWRRRQAGVNRVEAAAGP